MSTFTLHVGIFLHATNLRHGTDGFTSPAKEGVLTIFSPLKIRRKIKREMEVARRRGRRHKKLLDDLKDRRGYSYLKGEALDRTMWKHRFGGGFGPVVRQNTE